MEWHELFAGKCFISNLGEEQTVEIKNKETVLAQYAAWAPMAGNRSHQIVEISNDLNLLMEKYHIPADRVCTLVCS